MTPGQGAWWCFLRRWRWWLVVAPIQRQSRQLRRRPPTGRRTWPWSRPRWRPAPASSSRPRDCGRPGRRRLALSTTLSSRRSARSPPRRRRSRCPLVKRPAPSGCCARRPRMPSPCAPASTPTVSNRFRHRPKMRRPRPRPGRSRAAANRSPAPATSSPMATPRPAPSSTARALPRTCSALSSSITTPTTRATRVS